MLGACDQHAIERLDFPVGGGRTGDPSEQASCHAGSAGRSWSGGLRECERKLADDQLGAIDSSARRLATIPRRETRHHCREPQQRRRVVTDRRERVGNRGRHLRAVDLGTQRGDFLGDRTLATPQQEAHFFERRVRDDLFDRIAAIGELAFVDRADRRLGDDDARRAVVDALRLRDCDPASMRRAGFVRDGRARWRRLRAALRYRRVDRAPGGRLCGDSFSASRG